METQSPTPRWKQFFASNKKFLLGLMVGLLIASTVMGGVVTATGAMQGDGANGEIENIEPGMLNITDTQAREAVMQAYPDATITEVELDAESGTIVYDVGIDDGSEIMVDAATGEVLGVEEDDADPDGEDDDDSPSN